MTTRVTRKQFLSTLAAGFAGAVLRPARMLASPLTVAPRGLPGTGEGMPAEAFEKAIGTTFRVFKPSGGDPVDVVLKEVNTKPDSSTVQYSLTFVAPLGDNLPQQALRFEHPDIGTLSILVVKTRVDAQGQAWYRADFNLLPTQNTRRTRTLPGR